MIVKLLTEHHLEPLSLTGGCRGSSESTHVKMTNCWKSHALAHIYFNCLKTVRCISHIEFHASISFLTEKSNTNITDTRGFSLIKSTSCKAEALNCL